MLKSLLICMDGSDDSRSALELGLRWARRFDALAVGVAVVDKPGILSSKDVLFAGGHHWHATDPAPRLISDERHRIEEILEHFGRRCRDAGVVCNTLDDVGTPYVRILDEAQVYDLILLGRTTHFDFGHDHDATLEKVIQDSPRPVVAVPRELDGGEAVVVAYDGSLPAA
ncbi:universal stress protein, partial [Singulisphaera rosea]